MSVQRRRRNFSAWDSRTEVKREIERENRDPKNVELEEEEANVGRSCGESKRKQ